MEYSNYFICSIRKLRDYSNHTIHISVIIAILLDLVEILFSLILKRMSSLFLKFHFFHCCVLNFSQVKSFPISIFWELLFFKINKHLYSTLCLKKQSLNQKLKAFKKCDEPIQVKNKEQHKSFLYNTTPENGQLYVDARRRYS